jgi:hypothetical protein
VQAGGSGGKGLLVTEKNSSNQMESLENKGTTCLRGLVVRAIFRVAASALPKLTLPVL